MTMSMTVRVPQATKASRSSGYPRPAVAVGLLGVGGQVPTAVGDGHGGAGDGATVIP